MKFSLTRSMHALALACTLACLAAPALASVSVKADDPKLQYTGRIDFAQPAAPMISWPESAIAGTFSGASLALKFDDHEGKNFFNVFIDGDDAHPTVLQLERGLKTYPVAAHLAPGKHRFLVTKRTEGAEGSTLFEGLELADGGKLFEPLPRPKHRIEVFGDSITSGMGDESPDTGPDDRARDKNSHMSYAAITARALDAELHMTSQSGIGVMMSWFPFTMPDFYDQLSAVGDNDTHWDFSKWTPDVVVINLFQNDSWLIGRDHKMQPEPDDAARIQAYRTFVARIRQLYPKAYIVCALGSMDATRPGSPWPGYIRSAVAQLREGGDTRIDTIFFPYTGYGQHPRVKHQQANAALLTPFIRERMGW
ncbi:SGNH/GDSL hydrolase family protein [Massilia sp. 9096]|uniref:SGNH/GDSL hydrolase family protein n=1 Tax=Massilia sp. 9096 TaxID=1500894 RepID=UPI0009DE51B9|nr:SGNH/GDSL hydrolase family protein [Massilia sp. 9096]